MKFYTKILLIILLSTKVDGSNSENVSQFDYSNPSGYTTEQIELMMEISAETDYNADQLMKLPCVMSNSNLGAELHMLQNQAELCNKWSGKISPLFGIDLFGIDLFGIKGKKVIDHIIKNYRKETIDQMVEDIKIIKARLRDIKLERLNADAKIEADRPKIAMMEVESAFKIKEMEKDTKLKIELAQEKTKATLKAFITFFTRNRLTGIGIFIITIFFFYFLFKEVIPWLLKPAPKIVRETNIPTLFKKPIISKSHKLIYNKEPQSKIDLMITLDKKRIENNKKKNSKKILFHHLLLIGEPGTGKTSLIRYWAQKAGFNYIIIGSVRWKQMEVKEALKNFYDLIEFAKKSKKPILIFIDEVDGLFGDRNNNDELSRALTTAFLEVNEKPSNENIKWCFAMNSPKEGLDPAILDRISDILEIPPPNINTALAIFKFYLKKQLKGSNIVLGKLSKKELKIILAGKTPRSIEELTIKVVENAILDGKKRIRFDDFNIYSTVSQQKNNLKGK